MTYSMPCTMVLVVLVCLLAADFSSAQTTAKLDLSGFSSQHTTFRPESQNKDVLDQMESLPVIAIDSTKDLYRWHLRGNPALTCSYNTTVNTDPRPYKSVDSSENEELRRFEQDLNFSRRSIGNGKKPVGQEKFSSLDYIEDLVYLTYSYLKRLFPKVVALRCKNFRQIAEHLDSSKIDEERLVTVLLVILQNGLYSDTAKWTYDVEKYFESDNPFEDFEDPLYMSSDIFAQFTDEKI